MPIVTYPNQRTVTINRESAKRDFLGIKNENWQAAARDLGAHALLLYLYFASNCNGFQLALSPSAIRATVGMPPQTYRDQFVRLINKGYIVDNGHNHYSFYEVPQTKKESANEATETVCNKEFLTHAVNDNTKAVNNRTGNDIEINNIDRINTIKNIANEKQASHSDKFVF